MKKLLRLLLALSFCAPLFAVKIEDRYVMKAFEGGQIYFIVPYEIPAADAKDKPLLADVTYLTNADSVTMNISVRTPDELLADSVAIFAGERLPIPDYETFFIERDGKLWLHRYSLRYPLDTFKHIYTRPEPFTLCIYTHARTLRYAVTDKAWPKEQEWMNQILHIIDTNRRLYRH